MLYEDDDEDVDTLFDGEEGEDDVAMLSGGDDDGFVVARRSDSVLPRRGPSSRPPSRCQPPRHDATEYALTEEEDTSMSAFLMIVEQEKNYRRVQDDAAFNEESTKAFLAKVACAMYKYWTRPSSPIDLFPDMARRFNLLKLDEDPPAHMDMDSVNKMSAMRTFEMVCLMKLLHANDMLEELKDKVRRTMEVVTQGRHLLLTAYSIVASCNAELDAARQEHEIPITYMMSDHFLEFNGLQRILIHILKRLEQEGFRKAGKNGEECWSPLTFNEEGVPDPEGGIPQPQTHSWQRCMELKRFIDLETNNHISMELWNLRTKSPRIVDDLEKMIRESEYAEFPRLVFNRSFYSFRNGIYSIYHCFFPYDDLSSWDERAERCQEAWTRAGVEGVVVQKPMPLDCTVMYVDEEFPERLGEMFGVLVREGEEEEGGGGGGQGSRRTAAAAAAAAASSPPARLLLPLSDTFRSVLEGYAPALRTIVGTQVELDSRDREWLLALLGQSFRERKWLGENWQTMLLIKGTAGSGKSTLIEHLCSLFPPHKIATHSSSGEEIFGLEPLYGPRDDPNWLVVWPEAKDKTGIGQHDLQSMIACETVSIRRKNQQAFNVEWKIPIIAACNKIPMFDDHEGAMMRRLMVIPFNSKPVMNSDLPRQLKKERGAFLLLANLCYVHMFLRFQKFGLQQNDEHGVAIQGKQMLAERERIMKDLDPFFNFIVEKDNGLRFGSNLECDKSKLIDRFYDWATMRGIKRPGWSWKWDEKSIMNAFTRKSLSFADASETKVRGVDIAERLDE